MVGRCELQGQVAMSDDPRFPDTMPTSVLREVFERIDFDAAVKLVGILFENRIVFSKRFEGLLKDQTVRMSLDPLEPQDACLFVGQLFGFDCDALFLSFRRKWSSLRRSLAVKVMVRRIQAHDDVEQLEKWTPDL